MSPDGPSGTTATQEPPSASHAVPEQTPERKRVRRPELDGLRTVAVVLVIAFHAGLTRWRYGFIGVDVFFVLSGFLVTGLLRDRMSTGHATDVVTFIARRVRRLLPASLVMLTVVYVASQALLNPIDVLGATDDLRAAALFHANWHFIGESAGYFSEVDQSPFLHMWSLGVEEQFYLAWPLLFLGIAAVTPRRRDLVLGGALVAIVATSLWWSLHFDATALDRSYYGTDARVYQLAAGGLIAWWCSRRDVGRVASRRPEPIALVALIGIVVTAADADRLDPAQRGAVVTALTVALLWALHGDASARTRSILSIGPMPAIGRVSYGTYLWHWPLLVFLRAQTSLDAMQQFLVVLPLATLLGAASFVWLERPRLRRVASDRLVIVGGLAASLLVALALPTLVSGDAGASGRAMLDAPGDLLLEPASPDLPPPTASEIEAYLDGTSLTRYMGYDNFDCAPGKPAECIQRDGRGQRIHLAGDSVTGNWFVPLVELREADDLQLSTTLGASCPWETGLGFDPAVAPRSEEITRPCAGYRSWWYTDSVTNLAPDLVVIAARERDASQHRLDADAPVALAGTQRAELPYATARTTIERLVATGADVVVILPLPAGPDGRTCLADAAVIGDCIVRRTERSDYSVRLEQAVTEAGALVLDMGDVVCPRPDECDPIVDGHLTFRDPLHLSPPYARHFAPILRKRLIDLGVYDQ